MGRLRMLAIGMGWFAQRRRISDHIQQVVLNLECETDLSRKTAERLVHARVGGGGAGRRQYRARANQRAGLASVHLLHIENVESPALCGQIDRLSSGHSKSPARLGPSPEQ